MFDNGYDIKSVININKRLIDEEVIKFANSEKRILLTNDKDFGEIVFRQKLINNGVILVRMPGNTDKEKFNILMNALSKNLIKQDNFIVITKDKIRISPLGV